MRDYTKKAIEDKFNRLLYEERIDKDKQLLSSAGVVSNSDTLKVFLIGRLDTLIFDIVGALENRPAGQKEREKVIAILLPRIDEVVYHG